MSKLVAFYVPGRNKAYFFAGDQYVRFDVTSRSADAGYPKPIAGNWHGAFDRDIDAAMVRPDGSHAYFFQGSGYVKIDMKTNTVLPGYPKPISANWPGLFDSDIDAVLAAPGWDRCFFFRGSEYVRYDLTANRAVDAAPRSIADDWRGVFAKDLDTVLAWPDGHAYFFRGDEYTKWDLGANATVAGYPKPIAAHWPGLPTAGLDAVETPGGGRITDKTDPAAADLVEVVGYGGKKVRLHRLAAKHWQALVDAARTDGHADPLLLPTSGYRSYAYQKTLFDQAVVRYKSEAAARKWVAPPGGSPHQSGRAIDFWMGIANDSSNVDEQRKTAVWAWLVDNADRFGFYPYDNEPWHWEYNPPAR